MYSSYYFWPLNNSDRQHPHANHNIYVTQQRLIDWLIDWLIDRLMTDRLMDWLSDWPSDWLNDWLSDWLIDWLIDWLVDWLIDWLIDWLVDWLIDWLIGWLIRRKYFCYFSLFFYSLWTDSRAYLRKPFGLQWIQSSFKVYWQNIELDIYFDPEFDLDQR